MKDFLCYPYKIKVVEAKLAKALLQLLPIRWLNEIILYPKDKNEDFNFLDINKYNESVNNLNPYSIQCNCGCKGSCIKYGKYKRVIDKYEIFI